MKTVKAVRLMALAAMPITKADLAHEKAEFAETCERANRKGNRAHELLNSAECNPDRSTVEAMKNDYNTR